jgi:hypothetical protein
MCCFRFQFGSTLILSVNKGVDALLPKRNAVHRTFNPAKPGKIRPRNDSRKIYVAVAAAYGWSDLDLGHGFHATKQGERYTLSESDRRTILNHQR